METTTARATTPTHNTNYVTKFLLRTLSRPFRLLFISSDTGKILSDWLVLEATTIPCIDGRYVSIGFFFVFWFDPHRFQLI